ncbi:MAG TPA: BTAD domain-containing putative transcriptional regulator, partial [Jatrophihabitans sp.]|nr:BTAD domain-containing putative transcriptional regulator [Jatrophihabitans sp.]
MLEIKLFGTPEFRSRGTPIVLPSARAQNLLAYLALRHGTPQRRDHLAFLLWPDSTEKQARTNLRHVVHTLRASIPDADHYLRATPQTLAWDGSWVDVSVFEQTLASSDGDVADVAALRAATDLYAGDLLQGWYDDWVEPERERLRRRALVAHEQLVSLLTDTGEFDDAIDYAERARTLDPLAETTYRSLMRLYDARGDRARALRVYHEGVATLEENLGVEPSAETRAIYESLLPSTEAAPTSTAASPLVARQPERRRLTELWREARAGKAQLVLLTGEPGIGKTRLAEELRRWAAHRGAATASARSYAV